MGMIFKVPGMVIFLVSGIWGLIITLGIIANNFGTFLAAIAFFLAPFTLAFAPFYEGFVNSNWFPVVLIYGGAAVAFGLNFIGTMIDGE